MSGGRDGWIMAGATETDADAHDGQPLSARTGRTLSREEEREFSLKKRPWRRHITSAERLISQRYRGKGTLEDPYIVEWLTDDVENPYSWSLAYKWVITAIVACSTLVVSLSSSAFSAAFASMERQTGASEEALTLGITLFVLGFAGGPLLWAPVSEVLGRRNSFLFTFVVFTIFNCLGIAASNLQSILLFRFFAGFFGSSPLSNSGGTVADVFEARQRGLGMALFASAPFCGPALGPIIGGFVDEAGGYRWVQALLGMAAALMTLIGLAFLPETYGPVLLRQRADWMSAYTNRVYRAPVDAKGKIKLRPLFKKALSVPWILLLREPIVQLLTLYMALVYGTLYMLFGAYPYIFQELRGWSTGIGGLAFVGILVGMLAATAYSLLYDNGRYLRCVDRHGGTAPPEDRLPPAMVGGVALIVGLAWFTASCAPSTFWLVSVMAGAPFGFGMVILFLSCMNYLIDSYVIYAASVLAANSVLRSIFGAVFPLFATPMYKNLGVHWASAIPTLLAAACLPFPFIFYKYGERIRHSCKFAAEAAREHEAMKASEKERVIEIPAGLEKSDV